MKLAQPQIPLAEKFWGRSPSRRAKRKGVGGKESIRLRSGQAFALLRLRIERFRFPLVKRKPKQKIFHLLLKDKVNCEARESALGQKNGGAEKNKKCNEKISVLVCRSKAEASGNAPHYSGFCSKKVRISTKRYRQFTISAFWGEIASARCASAGALRAPKSHFARICHAPRGKPLQNQPFQPRPQARRPHHRCIKLPKTLKL